MIHGIRSVISLFPGFYLFYLRIFVPSAITSIVIALANLALGGTNFLAVAAYSFFLATPAFQFIQYDFINPGQYYFYNNLGLTRLVLWIMNIVVSSLIFIILSVI